jgi:hypothetical protein
MVLGIIILRWGVQALQKDPTKSSDYRVFVGSALLILGAVMSAASGIALLVE